MTTTENERTNTADLASAIQVIPAGSVPSEPSASLSNGEAKSVNKRSVDKRSPQKTSCFSSADFLDKIEQTAQTYAKRGLAFSLEVGKLLVGGTQAAIKEVKEPSKGDIQDAKRKFADAASLRLGKYLPTAGLSRYFKLWALHNLNSDIDNYSLAAALKLLPLVKFTLNDKGFVAAWNTSGNDGRKVEATNASAMVAKAIKEGWTTAKTDNEVKQLRSGLSSVQRDSVNLAKRKVLWYVQSTERVIGLSKRSEKRLRKLFSENPELSKAILALAAFAK